MSACSLRRNTMLKKRNDFQWVMSRGSVLSEIPIRLHYGIRQERAGSYKVAFIVPKRYLKSAVIRNRIKRRMRESFRQNKNLIPTLTLDPGFSERPRLFLVFFYNEVKEYSFQEINHKIIVLLQRLTRKISCNT